MQTLGCFKEFLINSAFHSDLHIQANTGHNDEGIVSPARAVLFNILNIQYIKNSNVGCGLGYTKVYTYYIVNGHVLTVSKMYLCQPL